MDKVITLELTVDEVRDIINVLGELPTRTNAWPLATKIQNMLNTQTEEE